MALSIQASPVLSAILPLLLVLIMAIGHATAALHLAYCSSENTGSSSSPGNYIYSCHRAQDAFADELLSSHEDVPVQWSLL